MKEDLPRWLVVGLTLFLTIVPLVLVKFNFFKRSVVYQGLVLDALDKTPVDLVQVMAEEKTTYTDKNGGYHLSLEAPVRGLTFLPTADFEDFEGTANCTLRERKFLQEIFSCSDWVYPQAFAVAARILATEIGIDFRSIEPVKERVKILWGYLSQPSQKAWGSLEEFVDAFALFSLIQFKLKNHPVAFSVSKEVEVLESFEYLPPVKILSGVVAVSVSVGLGNGKTSKQVLHFVREDNVWKYLIEATPKSVSEFNSKYKWALKLKD